MRFRLNLPGAIFLAVGLLLLAIGLWALQGTRAVRAWPRVPVHVDSSRVVNLGNGYTAEIAVRWTAGGRERTRKLDPGFSTSSYDWAHSFVERYAEGTEHRLPLNPADPDDLRLDASWDVGNLLVPVVLGGMGLLFGGIGLVACSEGLLDRLLKPTEWAGCAPTVFAGLFGGVAAVALLVAALSTWRTLDVLRTWPEVQALVVDASPVEVPGPRGPTLTVRLVFRYTVDGRTYETPTGPEWRTTNQRAIEAEIDQYATGTTVALRVKPGDPHVVRYGMGYDAWTFFVPLVSGLIALVFGTVAPVGYRFLR